jgi:hypothetical protein
VDVIRLRCQRLYSREGKLERVINLDQGHTSAQNSLEAKASAGVMEMGGRDWKDEPHMVTESVLRGFYNHYRKVMEV